MIRLIQLADLHFGTEDPDALSAAERTIEVSEADALVVCGDLTQRGKRREFAAAVEWLDQFDLPKLVVPGNHDTPLLNPYTRAFDPFGRFKRHFSDHLDTLDIGGWCLAGLNSARGWQARTNWAEGTINLDELSSAIGRGLERPRLLACHHPFLSPPGAPLRTATRRGRRASRLLARSPVELLLTGHVHAPSATIRRDGSEAYLAISAGTLSTRLRDQKPGFNLIELTDEAIRATAFSAEGAQLHRESLGAWQRGTLEPIAPSTVPPED